MAAITKVTLIGETFRKDDAGRAKATRKFSVTADGYMDSDVAMTAAEALGLPPVTEWFSETRPFCRCISQDVDRLNGSLWEVTLAYEDPTAVGFALGGDEDPLEQPAKIVVGVEMEQEEREYDGAGNRVCNAAGSRFTRQPTFPLQTAIYAVTKIVDAATKAAIKAAAGTLNASPIEIDGDTWAEREAWLVLGQNAFTEYVMPGDLHLYTASYAIRCKRGGWKIEVANIGHTDIDGDTVNQTLVSMKNKTNPPMGWPLDDDGDFMAHASDEPTKRTFWLCDENPWTGVPLA